MMLEDHCGKIEYKREDDMQVKNYRDSAGYWWREIVSRKYQALKTLGLEYQKTGNRTWLNLFDGCAGLWILTIQLSRG